MFCDHCDMQTPNTPSETEMLVACLCADWCGTCHAYQPLFKQLQTQFPGARFLWIDIEDESDLLDPIEVENFPTLLIARGEQCLFFGTVTPHLQTLQRLLRSTTGGDAQPLASEPHRDSLIQRLWHHQL